MITLNITIRNNKNEYTVILFYILPQGWELELLVEIRAENKIRNVLSISPLDIQKEKNKHALWLIFIFM